MFSTVTGQRLSKCCLFSLEIHCGKMWNLLQNLPVYLVTNKDKVLKIIFNSSANSSSSRTSQAKLQFLESAVFTSFQNYVCIIICQEHLQSHSLLPAMGNWLAASFTFLYTPLPLEPFPNLLWIWKDQSGWLIAIQFMLPLRMTTVSDKLSVLVHSHSNKMFPV